MNIDASFSVQDDEKLSEEIQKEIDKEVIGMLISFAMNETIKELKKN